MWTVAKIKIKNLNTFKKELVEKAGNDIKFYYPKIEYFKYFGNKVKRFEKYMLENYLQIHKQFLFGAVKTVVLIWQQDLQVPHQNTEKFLYQLKLLLVKT